MSTEHLKPLPISGYTGQPQEAVNLVNANKKVEERILRIMDTYATTPDIDKRWLAIARTHIEQGFMALNRSVFKPQRISLPTDTRPVNPSKEV